MVKVLISLLEKTEGLTRRIKKNLQSKTDKQFNTLVKWYEDDVHNLKKSTFSNLSEKSLVFDLGGYEGQWTSDVYSRYNCTVFIFEPVKAFAKIIERRFKQNSKIHVFEYGLASSALEVPIAIDEFASSIVNSKIKSKNIEIIKLIDFQEFMLHKNISSIDLIKINIEGAEYDLLEYILDKNIIGRIGTLLIQFHNFSQEAEIRMQKIQLRLKNTHEQLYDYPFVWTCWEKRS
jgi:FkbM family methyltransferase